MSEIGFVFTVLYRDNDLIKVRVSATNGFFCGTAEIYVAAGHLSEAAVQLHGFPASTSDVRELMLGTFDPDSAGGGISMRLYCIDHSGHACVDSKVESDRDSVRAIQSATLTVPIEAAAVDSFVDELQKLAVGRAKAAYLRGNPGKLPE